MEKKSGKIFGTALLMVAVTLISKALGMLRDILLAANFGTATEAVAYEAASRMPITLFDFALGGVVTAAFIPIFNELLVKEGKKSAFDYAGKYFNLILLVTAAITAVGLIFSRQLISFLAPDIAENAAVLASSLSKIMFPMIIFTGIAYCYVGILQSYEKYTLPALMSLVSNFIMVAYFYVLCDKFGVVGLSAALLIGWFLQAVILAPSAHSLGFRFRPVGFIGDKSIAKSLKMAFPILVCAWLSPVCNVINTRFASAFEGGSAVAMVNYANRLYIIIVGIFSFVATNLLFPKLSRSEAAGDSESSMKFAASSIKILSLVMIPLAVGIFILSEPLIRFIFMRNRFTAHDAEITALVLRTLALGIPFMSANEVLTKLFFAKQKVKAPMLSSVIAIGGNLLLVYPLTEALGLAGIGISASLAIALCAVLNLVFLSKNGCLFKKNDATDFLKIALFSAIMGGTVFVISKRLTGDLTKLVLCGAVGIFIYGLLLMILPTSEVAEFKSKLKNKFFKARSI